MVGSKITELERVMGKEGRGMQIQIIMHGPEGERCACGEKKGGDLPSTVGSKSVAMFGSFGLLVM
jgi:hypothetical protein